MIFNALTQSTLCSRSDESPSNVFIVLTAITATATLRLQSLKKGNVSVVTLATLNCLFFIIYDPELKTAAVKLT